MNVERLLREVEKRLAHLSEADRAEALDAVREEFARERRHAASPGTVEVERERRAHAETVRDILEAINRQPSLDDTIEEVLKQVSRLIVFDSCSLALLDPAGAFRIIASRGYPDPARMKGLTFKDALSEMLRQGRTAIALDDVSADDRFARTEGRHLIRSWTGIPLLVEGEIIGLLCLDRNKVEPFDDEDLYRAKAVAFSAAAAIRKGQLLDKVRRYAALMERVVQVDEAVFAGRPAAELARTILEGALKIGAYKGGVLVLERDGNAYVAARSDREAASDQPVPAPLLARVATRLGAEQAAALAPAVALESEPLFLVPLATPDVLVGTLVLVDPDGESADDRLMEAYASRAAAAWVHALRQARSRP